MHVRDDISTIGVDLGGTKVLVGKVSNGAIIASNKNLVPSQGTEQEVIDCICKTIDLVLDDSISGIGIGVPSVVNVEKGIVYDVQNIPSWKEVHLKEILEEKYDLPVFLNNDANCFAIGEKFFGIGRDYKNFVGLIVGTGMAAGIIIDDKLYNGANCGAGEFGMIPYLDHNYEYYSAGQFFSNVHGIDGQVAFQKAERGDPGALSMFKEFGTHLGNAIVALLYALDPQIIILGGSVSQAFSFFEKSLFQSIQKFAYRSALDSLKIEVSTNPDIAVLGAAALCYNPISSKRYT